MIASSTAEPVLGSIPGSRDGLLGFSIRKLSVAVTFVPDLMAICSLHHMGLKVNSSNIGVLQGTLLPGIPRRWQGAVEVLISKRLTLPHGRGLS